jgi:uncharacterized repeat protein (TIGR03803 family)
MHQLHKTITRALRSGCLVALCLMAAVASEAAQPTFRVVYNLVGYDQPGGLIEGSPGVFYSIAGSGPSVAFSVTSQGIQTILGSIPKGSLFTSLLVAGTDGRFYTSVYSGTSQPEYGLLSVSPDANSKQIYPAQKIAPEMTQNLPNGKLLGVGVGLTAGVGWDIFEASLDGTVTPIAQFPLTDRTENVIYADDGNYYGAALAMNAPTGYVFRSTPSGTLTTLYNFPTGTFSNYLPTPLLQADDGNLYGSTVTGGANGTGMIYKLTLAGEFTLLYSFGKGQYPQGPASLIEASDGNLYGVSQANSGAGVIFRVTKSGQYTALHDMGEPAGLPPSWLIQGSDGILYGIAHAGGTTGEGTVFALDGGLSKPKPRARSVQPPSGPVGSEVHIWGYNLLSPSVSFNGVPAVTVSNSGSNYIVATVPEDATSGPITVTTPGGTSTTPTSFTVN